MANTNVTNPNNALEKIAQLLNNIVEEGKWTCVFLYALCSHIDDFAASV